MQLGAWNMPPTAEPNNCISTLHLFVSSHLPKCLVRMTLSGFCLRQRDSVSASFPQKHGFPSVGVYSEVNLILESVMKSAPQSRNTVLISWARCTNTDQYRSRSNKLAIAKTHRRSSRAKLVGAKTGVSCTPRAAIIA